MIREDHLMRRLIKLRERWHKEATINPTDFLRAVDLAIKECFRVIEEGVKDQREIQRRKPGHNLRWVCEDPKCTRPHNRGILL